MYTKILKFVLLTTLIMSGLFLKVTKTQGREISTGIDPAIIEIIAHPGTVVEETFNIFAQSEDSIQLSAQSFAPQGEFGQIQLTDQTSNDQKSTALDWVSFSDDEFMMPRSNDANPSVSRQMSLRVEVPKSAKSGDHYFSILVQNSGLKDSADNTNFDGSKHISIISINVLLTIKGEEKLNPDANIIELYTALIHLSAPHNLIARVENNGNTLFKTFGQVEVAGFLNRASYQESLIPLNVLTKSTRLIQNTTDNDGIIRINPQSDGIFKYLPNLYTVSLTIRPDNIDNLTKTATTQFLYIPKVFILFTVIVILLLILLIRFAKIKLIRRLRV